MIGSGGKVLAVIPARGGSKGIKRKNLCRIGGISLVGHAAIIAKKVRYVDKAIISTDDLDIAQEGERYGLELPFMRPKKFSEDNSSALEMWTHAWLQCEKYYNCRFEISILLEPTSPLRKVNDVEQSIDILTSGDSLAAATISRTPAHFTPHKRLVINDEGFVAFDHENGEYYSNRQKIPEYYYRNGICYALQRECLIDEGTIIGKKCAPVFIDRDIVNIDTPIDLKFAEFLYRLENSL